MLLEGSPEWFDSAAMKANLVASFPEVCDVHHVHVWGLTPQELMLTMHVQVTEQTRNPTDVVRRLKKMLRDDYGIGHSTVEIETDDCADH